MSQVHRTVLTLTALAMLAGCSGFRGKEDSPSTTVGETRASKMQVLNRLSGSGDRTQEAPVGDSLQLSLRGLASTPAAAPPELSPPPQESAAPITPAATEVTLRNILGDGATPSGPGGTAANPAGAPVPPAHPVRSRIPMPASANDPRSDPTPVHRPGTSGISADEMKNLF